MSHFYFYEALYHFGVYLVHECVLAEASVWVIIKMPMGAQLIWDFVFGYMSISTRHLELLFWRARLDSQTYSEDFQFSF